MVVVVLMVLVVFVLVLVWMLVLTVLVFVLMCDCVVCAVCEPVSWVHATVQHRPSPRPLSLLLLPSPS